MGKTVGSHHNYKRLNFNRDQFLLDIANKDISNTFATCHRDYYY